MEWEKKPHSKFLFTHPPPNFFRLLIRLRDHLLLPEHDTAVKYCVVVQCKDARGVVLLSGSVRGWGGSGASTYGVGDSGEWHFGGAQGWMIGGRYRET
jgi:hypothetical protein